MKLRATSSLLGSSVLVHAIGMLTGIVLARTLGPAGRGELASYVFWPPFLAGLFCLSLHTAATFHTARLRGSARSEGIKTLSTLVVVSAVVMAPVSYAILLFIDCSRFLGLMGFTAIFYFASEMVRPGFLGIAAGSHEYDKLAAFRLLAPAFYLAFITLFSLFGPLTPEIAVLAIVVASVFSAILPVYHYWEGFSIRRRFANEVLKSSVRFHPSQMLEVFRSGVDRLAIVAFLANEEIGVYFVASTFASAPFVALQQAFSTQLLSGFSASKLKVGTSRRLLHSIAIVSICAAVIFAILLLSMPIILPLLVGDGYDKAPDIAVVLSIAFAIRLSTTVVRVFLQSARSTFGLILFELSYIAGFLLSFLIINPSSAIEVSYCVLFGFGANALAAMGLIFWVWLNMKKEMVH